MRLVRESSSIPRLLVFPLLCLALFGLLWLRWRPDLILGLAHCPLKDGTGVPCPTCGGTHAAAALAAGHLSAAWAANPLVVVVGIGFAAWAMWAVLATILPRMRVTLALSPGEHKAARILAALCLLSAWAWQIVRTVP